MKPLNQPNPVLHFIRMDWFGHLSGIDFVEIKEKINDGTDGHARIIGSNTQYWIIGEPELHIHTSCTVLIIRVMLKIIPPPQRQSLRFLMLKYCVLLQTVMILLEMIILPSSKHNLFNEASQIIITAIRFHR
jgi:hypothetical protein